MTTIGKKNLAELTELELQLAFLRYNSLTPFLDDGVPLTALVQQANTSYRTLTRWVQQYRQKGLIGLAKKKRADYGEYRSVNEDLKLFIEGLALKKPQPSIASIYRKIRSALQTRIHLSQ